MRIISLTSWWWLLVLIPCITKSATYRYPVAVLSDKIHVLVLSQQNQNELELLLYDSSTQTAQKILSSRYLPAGVQLLPDESGFSFIDDGILCIKRFDLRSAHMIEPFEPLYNIEYIHWFDNESCYFHAIQAGHSGVYMMSIDGTVNTLLPGNGKSDYLYPYIISGTLFCIVRNQMPDATFHYSICMAPYQKLAKQNSSSSSATMLQQVVTIGTRPLALLHMIAYDQGFVLEYPSTRDSQDELFPISCYSFSLIAGRWQSSLLFTYRVPTALLFDPMNRLYESILPLMPFYGTECIYYCSCEPESKRLDIYCYSMLSKKSERCVQENRSLLMPYVVDHTLLYGGQTGENDVQAIKVLQIDPSRCYV